MRTLLIVLALPVLQAYVLVIKSGTAAATCAALGLVPADVTPGEAAAISAVIKGAPAAGNTAEIGAWWGKVFNTACVSAIAYNTSSSLSLSLACASHVVCGPSPHAGNLTKTTTTSTLTIPQTNVVTDRTTTTSIISVSLPTTTRTTRVSTILTTTTTINVTSPTATYPPLPSGSGWNAANTYAYVNTTSTLANAATKCQQYGLRLATISDFSLLGLQAFTGKKAFFAAQSPNVSLLVKTFAVSMGMGIYQMKDASIENSRSTNKVTCGKVNATGNWVYAAYSNPAINSYGTAKTFCQNNNQSGVAVFPGRNVTYTIANTLAGWNYARLATPFMYTCNFLNTIDPAYFPDYLISGGADCPTTTNGVICTR